MSSHLESEIVQSSGKVLQQSLGLHNIFPQACGIGTTTEAVTAHEKNEKALLQNSNPQPHTNMIYPWLVIIEHLGFWIFAQKIFGANLKFI